MRALLALGIGHRPERCASDYLRPLCRGGEAIQGIAALRLCRRHNRKLASHKVAGIVVKRKPSRRDGGIGAFGHQNRIQIHRPLRDEIIFCPVSSPATS